MFETAGKKPEAVHQGHAAVHIWIIGPVCVANCPSSGPLGLFPRYRAGPADLVQRADFAKQRDVLERLLSAGFQIAFSAATLGGPRAVATASATGAAGGGGPARATVEELVAQMNKRPRTVAEFATGDAEAFLRSMGAEGSHALLEGGRSHILLRADVATRRTALHEWVHRALQRRAGGPRPGEDAFIEGFLNRHKKLFGLE
jgi:hypothetical protein